MSKETINETSMSLEIENEKLKKALELSRTSGDKNNIGIRQEHTLHRVMKFYLSPSLENHEIKVGSRFADVMIGQTIYEVQTKSFNLLKDKLAFFLKDYEVILVHPMAESTYYYLSNEYGEIIKERKSPRHLKFFYCMRELYRIKEYLKDEHLKLRIIMMDMEELRIEKEKTSFMSKGYERENQIPKQIKRIYEINDYHDFLPILFEYDLPEVFTLKEFKKIMHLDERTASITLYLYCYLSLMERIGKRGNSYLYKIKSI